MIISKTPLRMSFFGGGTDFPAFFQKHGGCVLSTTFDKYCYVNVRHLPPFFDYSTELSYSQTERVRDVDSIKHPAIREAMKFVGLKDLRLTYEADLPARSGLGTSSAFAVGMLHAFYALLGRYADKRRLADDAIHLERRLCKESGGIQDQIAASFGGFNRLDFSDSGYRVKPVVLLPERKRQLNRSLMLFFTGFSRFSSDIQQSVDQMLSTDAKLVQLLRTKEIVDEAERLLSDEGESLAGFGKLLHEAWRLKRTLTASVSTPSIDNFYEKAMKAGALGGKLLGAGGGGFLLFYVEEEFQATVRQSLSELLYVPFEFEEAGSQIIYYSSDLMGDRVAQP